MRLAKSGFAAVLAVTAALTLAPARDVAADTRLVDCSLGRKIGPALRLPAGRMLTITVRGVCNENVTITRDDVTIQGDVGGATVNGTANVPAITIDGAHRITIQNLTISGPNQGIAAIRRAGFTVTGSTVQNNALTGIVLKSGARGVIDSNQILGNGGGISLEQAQAVITNNTIDAGASPKPGAGIQVAFSSSAKIGVTDSGAAAGNAIRNHTNYGLMVTNESMATLRSSTIELNQTGVLVTRSALTSAGGNTIRQNKTTGLLLEGATMRKAGGPRDTITLNGTQTASPAIEVAGNSAPNLDQIDVTSNAGVGLFVHGGGSLYLSNSTVSGNTLDGIQAFNGARIEIQDSQINGNVRDGIRLMLGSSGYVWTSGATNTLASSVNSNHGTGVGVFSNSVVKAATTSTGLPVSISGNATYDFWCSASHFLGNVTGLVSQNIAAGIVVDPLGTDCPFTGAPDTAPGL